MLMIVNGSWILKEIMYLLQMFLNFNKILVLEQSSLDNAEKKNKFSTKFSIHHKGSDTES